MLYTCYVHLLSVVEAGVSWRQEFVTARQGSTVSVTCIATDLNFLDVMRVELRASDGIVRIIADTTTVKAPFYHVPRYVVTFDYHDSIGNLTITYLGMLLFIFCISVSVMEPKPVFPEMKNRETGQFSQQKITLLA